MKYYKIVVDINARRIYIVCEYKKENKMQELSEVKLKIPQKEIVSRTTFTIDMDTVERIKRLSDKFEKTAKGVIEFSLEIDVIVRVAIEQSKKNNEREKANLIKKVYAINEDTRNTLNEISKDNKIPRDILFMNIMLALEALVYLNEKKEKEGETKALAILKELFSHMQNVGEQLEKVLDEDNPILERYGEVISAFDGLLQTVENKLKTGKYTDIY